MLEYGLEYWIERRHGLGAEFDPVMLTLHTDDQSKNFKDAFQSAANFFLVNCGDDSVLGEILREGRKYHVGLLLATQTLEPFSREKRSIIEQCATRFFFKPTAQEAQRISRQISKEKASYWENILSQQLLVGSFIATGRFQMGDKVIERPLLIV